MDILDLLQLDGLVQFLRQTGNVLLDRCDTLEALLLFLLESSELARDVLSISLLLTSRRGVNVMTMAVEGRNNKY